MIISHKRKAIWACASGSALHCIGMALAINAPTPFIKLVAGGTLLLIAMVVLGYGLSHLARGKGYSPMWGLACVVNIAGLMALLILPDKTMAKVPLVCQNCGYSLRGSNAEDPCPECGHVNIGEKANT